MLKTMLSWAAELYCTLVAVKFKFLVSACGLQSIAALPMQTVTLLGLTGVAWCHVPTGSPLGMSRR